MNASISSIIDSVRNSAGIPVSQSIANIADVVHQAYAKGSVESADGNAKPRELHKWIIIIAAIAGGFFLFSGLRKFFKLAFAMFWVWLFVGGHIHHRWW